MQDPTDGYFATIDFWEGTLRLRRNDALGIYFTSVFLVIIACGVNDRFFARKKNIRKNNSVLSE